MICSWPLPIALQLDHPLDQGSSLAESSTYCAFADSRQHKAYELLRYLQLRVDQQYVIP